MELMTDILEKIANLESRVGMLEKICSNLKPSNPFEHNPSGNNTDAEINLPSDMIDKISNLDEQKKLPVLWYYSTKPVMSVKEFMEIATKKGFTLNHSWLPSSGGAFSVTFVKKMGLFHQVKIKGKGNEKYWKLTDVGKFKITKMINELKK